MLTSAATDERRARRTWWFVYGAWAVLSLQALIFVILYPHSGPIIDEWEFITAVTGEESFWPWLWKLHNEHRFPLPRLIWLPLTQWTGDFRAGCYVSLVAVCLFTLQMIRLAARMRGQLHFADAFFPLTLLHVGHWENLRMGYQIVFMMNLVLAGWLLQIILTTSRDNLLRRGVQGGIVTLLLLGCGAGGLAFGPFMAVWLAYLFLLIVCTKSAGRRRAIALPMLAILFTVYIGLYLQGYHRPAHHRDPIETWGSQSAAAWQALRSAMQALSMAFGPGAIGLWPASAFIVGLVSFECIMHLARASIARVADRPRIVGLLLYFGAVLFMAFGIGWGRCVFLTADGQPGDMGFASRYCWIVWPGLAAIYFQWLLFGSKRQARWIPIVLFGITAAMLPFNVATGFIEGVKHQAYHAAWEQSVRAGMSDQALIEKYFPDYYADLKERMESSLLLLRRDQFQYYRPLNDPPASRTLPPRRRERSRSKGRGR